MIRVYIADDHAVVRRGVRQILADAPDLTVVGEAGSGRETVRGIRQTECDVLVLDMAMPDGNGLQVLQEIRSYKPLLPVLFLSMYPERQYAVRTLKAGAAGYLTKESAPNELIAAVRKAASGGKYVSQSLAERLASNLMTDTEPMETLSDREHQVMTLLAAGKTVATIAAELTLTVSTVSTYRTRILRKLRLDSTAELIRYALEQDLVA
jgi:two-component system invasion response regulator UvrY